MSQFQDPNSSDIRSFQDPSFAYLPTIRKIQIRHGQALDLYMYLFQKGFEDHLKPIPTMSTSIRFSVDDKYDLSIECDPLRPKLFFETILCVNNADYMTEFTRVQDWGYDDYNDCYLFYTHEEVLGEINRLLLLSKQSQKLTSQDRKKERQRIRNAIRRSKK